MSALRKLPPPPEGKVYLIDEYVDTNKASKPWLLDHAKMVLKFQGMLLHIKQEQIRRRKAREFEKFEQEDMA